MKDTIIKSITERELLHLARLYKARVKTLEELIMLATPDNELMSFEAISSAKSTYETAIKDIMNIYQVIHSIQ